MLTRVLIKNFQAHERFDVRLEPITVLVGDSDAGKSSVIRALRWLATNKPGGAEFIRDGAETSHVRIKVDGHTIQRERGKENTYSLDGNEFKAFGTTVPDTVEQLLNIDPILNFQDQHDAVFWFSESSAEVGRRLNSIVNLDVIDRVMADAASNSRAAKAELDVLTKQKQKATEELETLHYVPQMQANWDRILGIKEQQERLTIAVDVLQETIAEIRSYQKQMERLKVIGTEFQQIETTYACYRDFAGEISRLKRILSDIQRTKATLPKEMPDFGPIERRYQAKKERQREIEQLTNLLEETQLQQARIESIQNELKEAESRLKLEGEERCPTCGQTIPS